MATGPLLLLWFASQATLLAAAVGLYVQAMLGMAPAAFKTFGTIHRNTRNSAVIAICGLAVAVIDCGFIAGAWLSGDELSGNSLFYQVIALPMLAMILGFAIDGAISGEVAAIWANTGSFRRAEQPVRYWIAMILCAVSSVALAFGALAFFGVIE